MELIKKLEIEQRCYDLLRDKYYDELSEKEKHTKESIRHRTFKFVFSKIPWQGYCDKQSICEDAVENIFIDNCQTRLEALKFALKLKNSCDIYEEIADYINDDYILECWSEKSLKIYQDCLETYFSYYGDTIKSYKEINKAAQIGAYCLIERVAVETINTLADIAEDLGIEEDE